MRQLLLILFLCFGPASLSAQSAAFDEAMEGLDQVFESGGDPDRIYQYLTQTVRTSRAMGRNEPDFAIFYAMLADHVRNAELNPVYALQVAEEGLELIAGDPNQSDFAIILQITRSYALADLGRLDEAYSQAQLVLPGYRNLFDAAAADDYARDAANWGEGQLSDFNTAATELARETLDRAYAQMDARAYGRVLTLASTALLPMGTGMPEGDVRAINAEVEMLMARALGHLGRNGQAGNAWLRALGYLTVTPWALNDPPDWWGAGPVEGDHAVVFQIFDGLAGTAAIMGLREIEQAALTQASDYAATPRARYSILLRRARLAIADEDPAAGLALLRESRDVAAAAGDDLDRSVADFYIALTLARQEEAATGSFSPDPVIAATEAALASYRKHLVAEVEFILQNAAQVLVRSPAVDAALGYARQAMSVTRGRLAARDDTGFGQVQARRNARDTVELFLRAAHIAASDGADPRLAVPACDDPRGFMGCVVTGQ